MFPVRESSLGKRELVNVLATNDRIIIVDPMGGINIPPGTAARRAGGEIAL